MNVQLAAHILWERVLELNHDYDAIGGCGCVACAPNFWELWREQSDIDDHVIIHEKLAQRLTMEELSLPTELRRRIAIFADLPTSCPQPAVILETLRAAVPGGERAALALVHRNTKFKARLDTSRSWSYSDCVAYYH